MKVGTSRVSVVFVAFRPKPKIKILTSQSMSHDIIFDESKSILWHCFGATITLRFRMPAMRRVARRIAFGNLIGFAAAASTENQTAEARGVSRQARAEGLAARRAGAAPRHSRPAPATQTRHPPAAPAPPCRPPRPPAGRTAPARPVGQLRCAAFRQPHQHRQQRRRQRLLPTQPRASDPPAGGLPGRDPALVDQPQRCGSAIRFVP